MGEDLDPQRVEEPLRQAARPPGPGPQRPPVDQDHGGEGDRGRGEPGGRVPGHPPGDPGPDQGRAGQPGQGVDGHEPHTDGQRRPEGPDEPAEAEVGVGPGGGFGVDPRFVVARRERRHLGQQLLVGRHRSRQREMPSVRRGRRAGGARLPDPRCRSPSGRHAPPTQKGRRGGVGCIAGGFAAPPGAPTPGSSGERGPCPTPGRAHMVRGYGRSSGRNGRRCGAASTRRRRLFS